jgi:hypothetical protein
MVLHNLLRILVIVEHMAAGNRGHSKQVENPGLPVATMAEFEALNTKLYDDSEF